LLILCRVHPLKSLPLRSFKKLRFAIL